jgi:hypothetical protein
VVWCGFDKNNDMLVFDELYPESMTVPEISRAIQERNAFWKIKRPLYVIDPSFRNRSLSNAESVEGAFMREGIFPVPGQNDRIAGVLQMRARVEAKSLMVSQHCKHWLKEADRWVVSDDEVSGEGKPSRAKGAGGSFATMGPDHLMDPTRYVCMERLYFQRPKEKEPAWGGLASGTAPSLVQLKKHLAREPAVGPRYQSPITGSPPGQSQRALAGLCSVPPAASPRVTRRSAFRTALRTTASPTGRKSRIRCQLPGASMR